MTLLTQLTGTLVGFSLGLTGGGFIIVPALVTFSCMGMQRAIGTLLLVITLVSISGTAIHLFADKELSLQVAGVFGAGGLIGLFLGSLIAEKLKGPTLQRIFASAILLFAFFVIVKPCLLLNGLHSSL